MLRSPAFWNHNNYIYQIFIIEKAFWVKQYNELKLKGCLQELSTKFMMYDKLLDSHSNLPLISR